MPHDLDAALERFGHASFRPGQREAIETLLDVGRALLVAPTGGGKSLVYQVPASVLPGTTLVVSPLIALMHDQVDALTAVGVQATYLASTLDAAETRSRIAGIARGEFDLVYAAPERLVQPGFRALLRDLDCPLLAVDEAHCISQWGHDFRPEYRSIGEVAAQLPKARLLACTATATPVVRDEILEQLGLPADTPQLVHGFARPNLSLRATEYDGRRVRNQHVDAALAEALGQPGAGRGAALVYAPTRRGAEEEAQRLADKGWHSACYHAGLAPAARDRAQRAFAAGRLEVVAATNAFGMGIDRADVRAVVHLGPPGSLEAYYQEVGRAGRDGAPALGVLLHTPSDFPLRRSLIESGSEAGGADTVEHHWNLFLELMRWAEGGSCRHDAILRYFGDEAETLAGCGICDVCRGLAGGGSDEDPEAAALIVRKALSGVARVHRRFGQGAAVKLLRGESDERLSRAGLDRVKTFGVLGEFASTWLNRLLRRLVTAGLVVYEGGDRPVVALTEEGGRVMRGERTPRVLLPARGAGGRANRQTVRSQATAEDALDPAQSARFEALRAWRREGARRRAVPPYVIASDRTLRDIAARNPRTPEDLLLCHGVGPARAAQHGEEVIALLENLGDPPN